MHKLSATAAVVAVASATAGCAAPPRTFPMLVERAVDCGAPDSCAAAMQRAQLFLSQYAGWRLAAATPTLLQTYGPADSLTRPAYTVALSGGRIHVQLLCGTMGRHGCLVDSAPFADALLAAMR